MKNILLINFGGIGDEILFLSVVQTLKKDYPDSKITLCLEPRSRSITDLTSDIDEIITADIKKEGIGKYFEILKMLTKIRKKKYDVVISSGKSPVVAILEFLTGIKKRIGFKSKTSFLLTDSVQLNENQYASYMYHDLLKPISNKTPELPKIELKDEELSNYLLKDFLGKEYIALHPGVSEMSIRKGIYKSLSGNDWCELVLGILKKGKGVILLGGRDDKKIIDEIISNEEITSNSNFLNLAMKTKNLIELACLIQKSSTFICADSAPLHVAVGLNKRVLAFFGPTNEEKLLPKKDNFIAMTSKTACRPCLWHKRQRNCENSDCLKIEINEFLSKI